MCETEQITPLTMLPMCMAELKSFNLAAMSAPVCIRRGDALASLSGGTDTLCDPVSYSIRNLDTSDAIGGGFR